MRYLCEVMADLQTFGTRRRGLFSKLAVRQLGFLKLNFLRHVHLPLGGNIFDAHCVQVLITCTLSSTMRRMRITKQPPGCFPVSGLYDTLSGDT